MWIVFFSSEILVLNFKLKQLYLLQFRYQKFNLQLFASGGLVDFEKKRELFPLHRIFDSKNAINLDVT